MKEKKGKVYTKQAHTCTYFLDFRDGQVAYESIMTK